MSCLLSNKTEMEDLDIIESSYTENGCGPSFSKRLKLLATEKYFESKNITPNFSLPNFHGLLLDNASKNYYLLSQNTMQGKTSEGQYVMEDSVKYFGCKFGAVEMADFKRNQIQRKELSDMGLSEVNKNASLCQKVESKKQDFLMDMDMPYLFPFGCDNEGASEARNTTHGRENETFTVGNFEIDLLEPDCIVTLNEVAPTGGMNKLSDSKNDNGTPGCALENDILISAIPSLDESLSESQGTSDDGEHDVQQCNKAEGYPVVSTLFNDHGNPVSFPTEDNALWGISEMEKHGLKCKGNGALLEAGEKDKLEEKAEVNNYIMRPESTAAEIANHINSPIETLDAQLRKNLESVNSVDLQHILSRVPGNNAFRTAVESLSESTEHTLEKDPWNDSQTPDDAMNIAKETETVIYSKTGLMSVNKHIESESYVLLVEHRFENTYLDDLTALDTVKSYKDDVCTSKEKTNKVVITGINKKYTLDGLLIENCKVTNGELSLLPYRGITTKKDNKDDLFATATLPSDAVIPKWDSCQGDEQLEKHVENYVLRPVPLSSDSVPAIFNSSLAHKPAVESSHLVNQAPIIEYTTMLQSYSEVGQPSQEFTQNSTKPNVDLSNRSTQLFVGNECAEVIFQAGSTHCGIDNNKTSTESVSYEKPLNNDICDMRLGRKIARQDRTQLEGKICTSKSDDNVIPNFEAKKNFNFLLEELRLFLEKPAGTQNLLRQRLCKVLLIKQPEEQDSELQIDPMLRNPAEEKQESTDKGLNRHAMTSFRRQQETKPDRHRSEYEQEVPLECGHLTAEEEDSMYSTVKQKGHKHILDRRTTWTPAFVSLPSFNGQNQILPEQPRWLQPLKTCSRPIRVGLSKRARPRHLHGYLK